MKDDNQKTLELLNQIERALIEIKRNQLVIYRNIHESNASRLVEAETSLTRARRLLPY